MKVLRWSITIILALIVTCLAFVYFSPDFNIHVVMGESMKPTINVGDILITSSLGGLLNTEVEPGTIVTYQRGEELVTHRVLSIEGNTLVTKGDAVEDPDARPIEMSDIRGVYLFSIPYVGYVNDFIRTKVGWFTVIVIPSVLLITLLIRSLIKELRSHSDTMTYKKGGDAYQKP